MKTERIALEMSLSQIETDLKSTVFYQYHHKTKHTVEKLRSSNYRLDWGSQPNPFLHFEGAPVIDLPHVFEDSQQNYFQTMIEMSNQWCGRDKRSQSTTHGAACGENEFGKSEMPSPLSIEDFVSNLLYGGVAISAWKQVVGTEHRWALRVNASSGNLHPTDTAVLLRDDGESLKSGLYHYRVDKHKLEKRSAGDHVTPLIEFLSLQCAPPPVVLCLSTTFFREAWKYRDRAFRYCQHDVGHALAALTLSAAALGWSSRIVGLFPDDLLGTFLGMAGLLQKPMALVLLAPNGQFADHKHPAGLYKERVGLELPAVSEFSGKPNKLTSQIIEYPSIDRVYNATKYGVEEFVATRPVSLPVEMPGPIVGCADAIRLEADLSLASDACLQKSVHHTIRERRSAVDMDGKTAMERAHLEFILRASTLGFAADFQGVDIVEGVQWRSSSTDHLVQLYLYVHRVSGLRSGLYFFDRFEGKLIPLLQNDQREIAMSTSCFQDIACDGAFSISMIADFKAGYKLYGERCYRLVHHEAGYIGQMLYLSAHALGHDATGIGCFIDDAINNYLALDEGKEVIYNFTIGKAVIDPRLTTLPSYSFSK